MKRNSVFIFGVLVVVGISAFAYAMSDKEETYSWRYKMTVSVETPEGIKTGYAVREVINKIRPVPMDKRRPWRSNVTVKGEAAVVDLGSSGVLFVLLDGDDAWQVVFKTFPFSEGGARLRDPLITHL